MFQEEMLNKLNLMRMDDDDMDDFEDDYDDNEEEFDEDY